MKFPFIVAFIIAIILYILFDKKTYTKKRLIIYGAIIAMLVLAFFKFFKSNPEYTLKHLANHAESSSLYIALNGEDLVTYQDDIPRPLASVVKTIIAVEYAYQIADGTISKDTRVPLDVLKRYYIERTDGGAHEQWLDYMEENQRIENNTVALEDVAKGMITFSSNANTDYLIDLLGVDAINNRIEKLDLTGHDDVYPLVGALLLSQQNKDNSEGSKWMDDLYMLSKDDYKNLSLIVSEDMKNEAVNLSGGIDLKIKEQRVWSDRLPQAPAKTYGKLLHNIATESFPPEVSTTVRELMEWPMEMVEGNKDLYNAVGAKGGSTAFVYNQAMYIEAKNGDLYEIVIFTDDLSFWQSLMLSLHTNAFIVEIVNNDDFLNKVQSTL